MFIACFIFRRVHMAKLLSRCLNSDCNRVDGLLLVFLGESLPSGLLVRLAGAWAWGPESSGPAVLVASLPSRQLREKVRCVHERRTGRGSPVLGLSCLRAAGKMTCPISVTRHRNTLPTRGRETGPPGHLPGARPPSATERRRPVRGPHRRHRIPFCQTPLRSQRHPAVSSP